MKKFLVTLKYEINVPVEIKASSEKEATKILVEKYEERLPRNTLKDGQVYFITFSMEEI